MRQSILIVLFLIIYSTMSMGQRVVKNLSYKSIDEIGQLSIDPRLFATIKIDSSLLQRVLNNDESIKKPLRTFVQGIYYFQQSDMLTSRIYFNEVLLQETATVCEEENSIQEKYQCAKSLRDIKAAVLRKRIMEAFENENSIAYCRDYNTLMNTIEAEKVMYESKFYTGSRCGTSFENPIFWFYPYRFLTYKFIEYDCRYKSMNKSELRYFRDAISNKVLHYPASDTIQVEVIKRINDFLVRTNQLKNTQKELIDFIQDFKDNATLYKNTYYFYKGSVCGIDIVLETSGTRDKESYDGRIYWSENQFERIENNQPIQTKQEIIDDFKRTKYYNYFMTGKL